MPRYTFGKLYPKEKGDKDGKRKKAKAKPPARKKDEKPPKPIRWADAPQVDTTHTLQLMRDARKDINANIFPVNNRGEASNPGIAPCIIKEVFFPPDSPQEVATLVESALVY